LANLIGSFTVHPIAAFPAGKIQRIFKAFSWYLALWQPVDEGLGWWGVSAVRGAACYIRPAHSEQRLFGCL